LEFIGAIHFENIYEVLYGNLDEEMKVDTFVLVGKEVKALFKQLTDTGVCLVINSE
jgi:hypothetical protein